MKRLSLLLIACAACRAQTPPPVTVPDGIALEANIAYDRFPTTLLDVLYPKAPSKAKRPGAIIFHGGAGHGFSKEQRPAVHARIFDFLATRGILAAAQAAAQVSTQAGSANPGDEAAIKDVVARYVDARDRKDAKATEVLFTRDADQLVSSGEWRKGRDEVVRGTMASSESSGGKRTITVETIRFVTPDAALADGRYEIAGLAGAPPRRMWSTFLMTRTPNGWRIAAIRNMLPAPPAAPK
jgi:uncharacterized protein (TIGR02246 family)